MAEQLKAEIRSKTPAENAANFRLLLVSGLAAVIGIGAGIIAHILYNLIGLFTNLAFFQRFSFVFSSPRFSNLGPLIIFIPVIGGIVVGIMAKYGTPKSKGHGIPEAMEAVLVSRSDPKKMIGYLGRSGVMQARLRRLQEEHVIEPGWFARWSS